MTEEVNSATTLPAVEKIRVREMPENQASHLKVWEPVLNFSIPLTSVPGLLHDILPFA